MQICPQEDGYYHAFVDASTAHYDAEPNSHDIIKNWSNSGLGIVILTKDRRNPYTRAVSVSLLEEHFLRSHDYHHKGRIQFLEKLSILTALSLVPENAKVKVFNDNHSAVNFSKKKAEIPEQEPKPTQHNAPPNPLLPSLLRLNTAMQHIEFFHAGRGSELIQDPFVKYHMAIAHNKSREGSGLAPNKCPIYPDKSINEIALENPELAWPIIASEL